MLGAYRRALDGIVSAALATLIRLLRGGYDPETPALKMSEELALQVVEPLRMARQSAYNEAVKFIRETAAAQGIRSEEHTSELQSRGQLVCRLLLEKKK